MTETDTLQARLRLVLNHPEHKRGLSELALEIIDRPVEIGPYRRISGELVSLSAPDGTPPELGPTDLDEIDLGDHHEIAAWSIPNTAFRILVPDDPGNDLANRIYTVRTFDDATRVLTFDVLVHPGASPMMRWLDTVKRGDVVPIIGPRAHLRPADSATEVVFFADESAVPALDSILRMWPGTRAVAYVQSNHSEVLDTLPRITEVAVRRIGGKQGDGSLLAAASGHTFAPGIAVWAAGERAEMRALRNHVRALDVAVPRDRQHIFGYWQAGTASSQLDIDRVHYFGSLIEKGKSVEGVDDLDIPPTQ